MVKVRTIQRGNSKTLEEGRWKSFYFNTYYKVIKVMRYWYKKTNKSTEQNTVLRNNSLCIYICKVYSQGCQIHKRERTGSIAQIPRFHQLLCILTPDFHVQFPYPGWQSRQLVKSGNQISWTCPFPCVYLNILVNIPYIYIHKELFLSTVFCSVGLFVCFCTSTTSPWLPCNRCWKRKTSIFLLQEFCCLLLE